MTDQEKVKERIQHEMTAKVLGKEIKEKLIIQWKELDNIHALCVQLTSCIWSIADYCKTQQGCYQCLIKPWCKSLKNKCPEEWRSKICQEIDTQVVDQDKKN